MVPVIFVLEIISLVAGWFEYKINRQFVAEGNLLELTKVSSNVTNLLYHIPARIWSLNNKGEQILFEGDYWDAYKDAECYL